MNKTTTFELEGARTLTVSTGGIVTATTGFNAGEEPVTVLGFFISAQNVARPYDLSMQFLQGRDADLACGLLPLVDNHRGRQLLDGKVAATSSI